MTKNTLGKEGNMNDNKMTDPLNERRTFSGQVHCEQHATWVIIQLCHSGMTFQLTPLPDDDFEITVKAENTDRLIKLLHACPYLLSEGP